MVNLFLLTSNGIYSCSPQLRNAPEILFVPLRFSSRPFGALTLAQNICRIYVRAYIVESRILDQKQKRHHQGEAQTKEVPFTNPIRKDGKDTVEEGCRGPQEGRRQEKVEAHRVLFIVYLQGVETGSSRYRHQQEGNVHNEFLHQRHLRSYRW